MQLLPPTEPDQSRSTSPLPTGHLRNATSSSEVRLFFRFAHTTIFALCPHPTEPSSPPHFSYKPGNIHVLCEWTSLRLFLIFFLLQFYFIERVTSLILGHATHLLILPPPPTSPDPYTPLPPPPHLFCFSTIQFCPCRAVPDDHLYLRIRNRYRLSNAPSTFLQKPLSPPPCPLEIPCVPLHLLIHLDRPRAARELTSGTKTGQS